MFIDYQHDIIYQREVLRILACITLQFNVNLRNNEGSEE